MQEVSTATSLEEALPRVVRRVRNSLSVDVCSVYRADEGGDQFVLMAPDGLGSESAGRVRVGQHEGLLADAIAHRHGKPASVCGELASDPAGALALLGMKVDGLGMSPARLSRVKLVIRSFTWQRARTLLDAALGMEDGFAVHRLLNSALEDAGVGRRVTTTPEDFPARSADSTLVL